MSHIAKVGRNSPRVWAGMGLLYLILIAGAVTTVYPFLLMVSTATKSQVDYTKNEELIPGYWASDADLYRKYLEDRYANNLDDLNAAHNAEYASYPEVTPPKGASDPQARELAKSWSEFTATLPLEYKKAGFGEHDNAPSLLLLRYREHLRKKFSNITALNEAWTEENIGFDNVFPPFERTALRDWTPDLKNPKVADWTEFKRSLPPNFLITTTIDPLYRKYLREDVYEDDLAKLNAAWGTNFASWTEITLPFTVPSGPAARRADWEKFVREKFPLRMLQVAERYQSEAWRRYSEMKARTGAGIASTDNYLTLMKDPALRADWAKFIAANAPLEWLLAASPENRWRESGADTQPPQAAADWQFATANAGTLRSDFATRNFSTVAGYILLHGRAVLNTFIFCSLAILGAVIVNPLCAYALSRYPLPYAYKVLLFVLATMAFPAEVAMIPNFLLLKDLGMLNTFWALVLPGLASGFSIFLLKGFFDSLPKELYEAGILDGASEVTMFRRITVPLSLPIFSVIALNAFTASYGAFLFAMVVCQDPKMWTLMVWLYDLQSAAPQYVIMAALTLAALPTLIVFLFAQKVILRGIILPSFK